MHCSGSGAVHAAASREVDEQRAELANLEVLV